MKRVVPYIVLALAALLPVQCASAQSHRGRQHAEREDVRQYRITRQEYIKMYKDLAIAQMKRTGIPASIILAQACLESGNGNSYLAREGNNHFGIKCHGWQGAVIYRDDDAPDECFRRYDKVEDSFADHSDFLRYRDRYAPLFELPVTDYRGWAYGLQKAGYATAGNYAEMLVRIIEENDLDSYDRLRKRAISKLPPTPAEAEVSEKATPKKKSLAYRVSLSREVFVRNGANYIVAESYDSYSSIAAEYNLFVKELLRFNDLKKEQPRLYHPEGEQGGKIPRCTRDRGVGDDARNIAALRRTAQVAL